MHLRTIARLVISLTFLPLSASPTAAQTTPSDPVLSGYMRFYGGESEAAHEHFKTLHAKDPQNLPVWFGMLFAHRARIELDEALLAPFEKSIDEFLAKAEQRHSRSAADTEALFYLAQGYLLRGIQRIEQDKVWGGARDAAKSKGFAEQYITRHPEHADAYLTLGLYNYYVDIAPNFVKVLRILLFLPSGDRAKGMQQLERTAREGSLFAPLAEIALGEIYGSLEGRLADGIRVAERLVQRFPRNSGMRFELAGMYMHPSLEAYDRAAAQYEAVMQMANTSSIEHLNARYQAIFGMANLKRTQWRLEESIALFTPLIDQKVDKPKWVLANAMLRRANYRALLNDPNATDDARRVRGDPAMATSHKGADQMIRFIENRRSSAEGTIYTALIPGNRAMVERRWNDALAVYDRVDAAHPGDLQVRYRRAYLEFARGNYDAASRGMQTIVSSTARMPGWLKAAAMLNLAWAHDIAGRRQEAVKLYKQIVDSHENEGSAQSARLGLVAPYRGRVTSNE